MVVKRMEVVIGHDIERNQFVLSEAGKAAVEVEDIRRLSDKLIRDPIYLLIHVFAQLWRYC